MFRRFVLPFMLLLFATPLIVHAQEVDHVYLESGSIIRGKIIELIPGDHVLIEDLAGNTWSYPMQEVEKISSENYSSPLDHGRNSGFGPGFVNITSAGFLAGSTHNEQVAPFSLQTVNGYRNNMGLFAGAGVGIEFLSTNYMPLFLDLRFDPGRGGVRPFIVARGGYALPLTRDYTEYDVAYDYSGGAMAAGGVGLKIRTRENFAWDLCLMYRYQLTSYKQVYEWDHQEYEYTDIYRRLEIRIGFYID